MKKIILTIAIIALSISVFAQDSIKAATFNTKVLKARTATQEVEAARMDMNFQAVNPDTLDVKKAVIWMAKEGDQVFYYIKVKAKFYKINWVDINCLMQNQAIYNMRSEGDSLIMYGDKGVKLFSIQ